MSEPGEMGEVNDWVLAIATEQAAVRGGVVGARVVFGREWGSTCAGESVCSRAATGTWKLWCVFTGSRKQVLEQSGMWPCSASKSCAIVGGRRTGAGAGGVSAVLEWWSVVVKCAILCRQGAVVWCCRGRASFLYAGRSLRLVERAGPCNFPIGHPRR
jgi:hypothetical protein